MSLNQKIAIVTGASSGIGEATAIELANRGATIIVSDINTKKGQSVVDKINENGGKAIFIRANVADDNDVNILINQTLEQFGRLDIMINNAGIAGNLSFFEHISDEDWNSIIAVNQTGVFYCMRAALKVMKAQKNGCIVNTSSVAGIGAAPRMGAYAASKHAVIGMTKTAAVEYAKYNIRINSICPTVIKTPMGMGYMDEDIQVQQMVKAAIPMKRFGEANEVARTVCWLCSDDASFITGESIRIDGGMKA
ncbi:MAG: SDR family NAD(P)-dependent oxidoreductase [Saprospiraceae bacterium]